MVRSKGEARTIVLEPNYLQKEGLKCVSIRFGEVIERNKRLDASFFDIEGRKARRDIEKCPYPKLPLLGENGFAERAFHYPRFRRVFVESGLPIYTAFQILETLPKADKFVSEKTKTKLDDLKLKEGQIVLTCSGSIGFCSLVTDTLKDKLFSHDLIRIECKNHDEIGFVYAFLKTKIGNKMLTTNNYGSVVTHIEPEHLKNIPIPNFPDVIKKEIHEKIVRSFKLRDEANELVVKADELLKKELLLPSLESLNATYLDNLKAFLVNLSKWQHRLDASYHLPITDIIRDQLKKAPAEITTLGDGRVSEKIIFPGRFKRVYVDERYGVPFLSSSDIVQFDPLQVKHLSAKQHNKRIAEQVTLRQNMILVTRSGTIGNIVLTPRHFEKWTASEHILRVVPSGGINAGYVYSFLASEYGQALIKQHTYGSVVNEIDDKQLASIDFPLPSKVVQDKIGNPILTANEKRGEAYYLEKEAINDVESLILQKGTLEPFASIQCG